jgi:AcrR family transcriptional regulator
VYHHFASKEQLYLAMMHADLEQKERLHRQSVALAGTCRERLRWLTADFLALPKRERELISLVRRDSNIFTDAARGELVRAYQRALPDQIERIIRDGVRDGERVPCDPRLLAWQFVALVEVIMAPYCDQRFARDEDKLNYVISQFFLGCARARGGDDR